MGNHGDNGRSASIEVGLDPSDGSGLVVDDEGGGSGIVVDDDRVAGSGIVAGDGDGDDDDDGGEDDRGGSAPRRRADPSRPTASARFGDPQALTAADAQRISEGKLETSKVLGLLERESLAQLSDEEVRGQAARLLKKLSTLELQYGDLQKARNKFLGYREWLTQIQGMKDAPDAAQRLRALVAAEERRVALDELEVHVRVALDDKVLEWVEHQKILRKAAQLGLSPDDVEAVYRAFEPFEREPQAAAERAAATGWIPHPKLAVAGEVYAWNLKRLRDILLERFDVAIELANQPHDKTYSLYDYLDRNREEQHKDRALVARAAAEEAQNPALAVWHFLWTTGPAVLHLGGKGYRPVRGRKRQVDSLDELRMLVQTEWVIDELALALEGGLLENWLFAVTKDEALGRAAAAMRHAARGTPDSKRPEALRLAALRLLWRSGLRGLPLRDGAKRSVLVEDLPQLVARAEDCWDSLEWSLRSGALAEWLDGFDPHQAARARAVLAP